MLYRSLSIDRETTAVDDRARRGQARSAPAAGRSIKSGGHVAPIALGAGTLLFNCFGAAYALPVLFPSLSRALAIPLPHLTALFSVTGALYFSLGVASGPLADRIGARLVAVVGCLILASGLFLASRAGGEPTFDIGYVLGIGVGVGLCFVPTVGAVQALCPKNPALAGGVAASGIGLGTLVLPPLAQLLIDQAGWRQALQLLSILAACGGLAALRLMAPGATNDGHRLLPSEGPPTALLRSRIFLLLYGAQLAISLVAFVPFAHLALFAVARGWSAATGGYLIGLLGIGSLSGRLLLGFVAETLGSSRTASLCAMLMAVSLLLLLPATSRWELGGVVALYGVGYGGVIGLTGPIVAEILGVGGICASVGFVTTARALGILIGPWAVGLTAHRFGSYDIPFLGCAALASFGAFLLGDLHRRAVGHRRCGEVFHCRAAE